MEVKPPLRIAITPFEPIADEAYYITSILKHGWDYVHLRHPGATMRDIRNIIEKVPQKFHRNIKLHGHFELVNEFNLGGLHLNSRCPEPPQLYNGKLSRTCHSIPEAIKWAPEMEYVTLSPVFDSISKTGYKSAFSIDDLNHLPEGRTIALGGITPENLKLLSGRGFSGYAVLGYLFSANDLNDFEQRLEQFDNIYI